MGFSGGGSSILRNHTHDGTVLQDGGPLDMDNVTQADLTAGDIVFSDGVHLQRLAISGANDELRVNAGATAPEWYTPAAPGGSTWTQLGTTNVVSPEGGFNALVVSGLTATLADYSEIVGVANLATGTNSFGCRINGLTTSTYNWFTNTVYGANLTHDQGVTGQPAWICGRFNIANATGAHLTIRLSRNDDYNDYVFFTSTVGGVNGQTVSGGVNTTDIDTLTSLSVLSEGQDLPAGELTVYGITKT